MDTSTGPFSTELHNTEFLGSLPLFRFGLRVTRAIIANDGLNSR
jgi:hypothetical protein